MAKTKTHTQRWGELEILLQAAIKKAEDGDSDTATGEIRAYSSVLAWMNEKSSLLDRLFDRG